MISTLRHRQTQKVYKEEKSLNHWGFVYVTQIFVAQTFCLFLMLAMLKSVSANPQPDAIATYDPREDQAQGQLVMMNQAGATFSAPPLETQIDLEVSGLTETVVVQQSFENISNGK